MPTDLPVPVAPAISRCGILARSAMTGRPSRSSPSVTGSNRSSAVHCSSSSSSRKHHHARLGIRHLDAHHVAAGNPGHAHRARAHLEGQVVGEGNQPIHLDARAEPHAVLRDYRPVVRPATSPSTLNSASVPSSRSCSSSSSASPASMRGCVAASSRSTSQTSPLHLAGGRLASAFFGPLRLRRLAVALRRRAWPTALPSPPSRTGRPGLRGVVGRATRLRLRLGAGLSRAASPACARGAAAGATRTSRV